MELKAGRAHIRIDPAHGGRLASLQIDGREVLVTESDDPRGWGAYPMVPWAGRVRSGRFAWRDQTIELPINCGPHAIHGTVLDAPWTPEGPDSLSCSLGPVWPWPGAVQSRFELSPDALRWTLEVRAHETPFPVVVGWHPWFRRELEPGVRLKYTIDAESMYVRDEVGMPSGELISPPEGPYDDCFRGLRSDPKLRWSDGLEFTVSSSGKHWVVYDEPAHAVCIEPQSGPPDAFNMGGFDVASPGHPVVHQMTLRWR